MDEEEENFFRNGVRRFADDSLQRKREGERERERQKI